MAQLGLSNQEFEQEDHSLADLDLVSKYLNGDKGAFDALVRRYQASLGLFASSILRDGELVKDAMQDFWLKISDPEILMKYEGRASFKTWLCSVLRNVCLSMLRHQKVVSRTFSGAEFDANRFADGGSMVSVERLELRRSLSRVLSQIRPEAVELLMMRFEDGLQNKEIAAELRIPLGTVQSGIFYSLRKIRGLLEAN